MGWQKFCEWLSSWFRPSQRADFEALVATQHADFDKIITALSKQNADLRQEFADYRTWTSERIRGLEQRLDTTREEAHRDQLDCAGKLAALKAQVGDLRAQLAQTRRRPSEGSDPSMPVVP